MVAKRLPEESLGLMAMDPEPEVRRIVASRMTGDSVKPLLEDSDWTVRLAAVMNAPIGLLEELADDADPEVREAVQERLKLEKAENTD